LHLTIGDVIFWNDFPYPKDGEIKARWFIYLGRSPALLSPIFAYLCTTTTQLEKFEPGGKRAGHAFRRFDTKNFSIFERNCILDFDEEIYNIDADILIRCAANIESKGRLDENTMRNIYKLFLSSGTCSPMIMRDIYNSYNMSGIVGLKKP
jgi:hypothetical protein